MTFHKEDITKLHKSRPTQAYQNLPAVHQMKKKFASLLAPTEES